LRLFNTSNITLQRSLEKDNNTKKQNI
jgi:hypothetical protein